MWHFPLKEMLISFWFLLPFDLGTATCRDATKRVRDVHADFFHKPSVFMSWKYLLSSGDFQWKKKKMPVSFKAHPIAHGKKKSS